MISDVKEDALNEFLRTSYRKYSAESHTLKETTYLTLKHAILSSQIKESITEKQISDALGISRTPVREAMHRLSTDGLMEITHGRKAQIRTLTQKDIFDISTILNSLHSLAIELCVDSATPQDIHDMEETIALLRFYTDRMDIARIAFYNSQFHLQIAKATKNKWLVDIMEKLLSYTFVYREYAVSRPERPEKAYSEHARLLDTIIAKDKALARRLIFEHVNEAFHNL